MKSIHDILLAALAMALALACSGCMHDGRSDEPCPCEQTGSVKFSINARSANDEVLTPGTAGRHFHLYVAERLAEHSVDAPNDMTPEALHCDSERRYPLLSDEYLVGELYNQWYRFAFVSVPTFVLSNPADYSKMLTEDNPASKSHDFTRLLMDFQPVLSYQETHLNAAMTSDLNLYRATIDRWVVADKLSVEDVTLRRITGELLLDMGILADQFEKPVEFVSLTLLKPMASVYIHDEARNAVICKPSVTDMVYTIDFSHLRDDAEELKAEMKKRRQFRLCLLPQSLKGYITVKFFDTNVSCVLPIGDDPAKGETKIEIRKNQITTALYNALTTKQFEVRYAGFDHGGDAEVSVDEDEWDGWENL